MLEQQFTVGATFNHFIQLILRYLNETMREVWRKNVSLISISIFISL